MPSPKPCPDVRDPPGTKSPSPEPAVAAIDSASLLRGATEVAIRHNGRVYRLRRTRLGKLILTG